MKFLHILLGFMAGLLPLSAMAALSEYQRPVPQPQSATAEFWFLFASITLFASLYAVHWMVNRK
ncbi:hypothetical protein [Pseudovibrio sp. Tun.PSC04-5.I4]|uniref:hypothetical protein n=1 Tax=Pseudovibrio sp. Tun.PSC04-5.I4 TaxID=1798213 RepID=UPI00087F9DC0|nr:hypothetical protein [Pseudovibrio sp. Tun.PSC04-5.I4]SDR33777.1 hypothetical protein SAMN04515695_4655 [Pseudovibrio sp. Tun.PSC04-5.I4]